jgi:hypothetical protein
VNEDDSQACWFQIEVENRQRHEQEMRWLSSDPAYEQWLEKLYSEMNDHEISSESEC